MDARLLGLILALAVFGIASCVQNDGTRFNPIDMMDTSFSEDEEREIGMNFDRELQKSVTVIYDPVVAGFLNDLGQSLVKHIEPQPFIYRFRVIEAPTLNAFAVPGGYIYFHSETILSASSVDELAGVMGHEIAHIKASHFERMQKKNQLPSLLATFAGAAAAVAAQDVTPLIASQAANVALQLRFSREFETEADHLGGIFTTRGGYDPAGSAVFFERIVEKQERTPTQIPPYLYSHPAAKDRIQTVRDAAETLHSNNVPDPDMQTSMRRAQSRLRYLIDRNRASLTAGAPPADRSRTDPYLREADDLLQEGHREEALLVLSRAEALEPYDPRVPFEIGEILLAAGRPAEAAVALRRTSAIDPSRALVFFRLGEAHERAGDRHDAVYAFEQVLHRARPGSQIFEHASWEVEKLTFRIVRQDGFADGEEDDDAATPAGNAIEIATIGDRRVAWWARLAPRFVPYAPKIEVIWTDPDGNPVQEEPAESYDKPYIGSVLELPSPGIQTEGLWTVEARIESDLLHRATLRVEAAR